MKTIKIFIQRILLYLLKKLNMPRPFSEFTSHNMLEIHSFIGRTITYKNYMELHHIPDLYEDNTTIVADKTNDYGTLEYTRKEDNAKASINIDKDYNVVVERLDSATTEMITNLVRDYLHQTKFLP